MAEPINPLARALGVLTATASVPTPSLPSAIQTATPVPPPLPLPASVPRWKRSHDSRMRKKVAKILVLKMVGHRTAEIARRLKTTPDTVRHYLYIAGKNGWLAPDGLEMVDPAEQLLYSSEHKVVRNINLALDGQPLLPQQFEMTLETAKGTGLFKQHSAAKIEGQVSIPSLEVHIQIPHGAASLALPDAGSLGGAPAYVDGQVIEAAETKQLPAPKEQD